MKCNLLVEEKWKKIIKTKMLNFSSEDWENMWNFRREISWHIPSDSLIDLLKSYSPIVSVGSGLAYTEKMVLEKGGEIVATDLYPDKTNKWCTGEFNRMGIDKKSSSEAVKAYPDRNVFMAWPPYDNPMAFETVKAMEVGRFLIYIGEGYGGCTGDDNLFHYLDSHFEEKETGARVTSWEMVHDRVRVYKKIK